MAYEFPLLFSAENAHNLYFVARDGRPVSLAGMRHGLIQVRGSTISVASMGSVCTLPEYRGLHLASTIVEAILNDFRADVSLILISGDKSIYLRQGFVRFGRFAHFQFEDIALATGHTQPPDLTIRSLDDDRDDRSLCLLYADEPSGFGRTPDEMRQLLGVEIVRKRQQNRSASSIYGAFADNQLVAYAVATPSLPNGERVTLSEWAGDRNALLPILKQACREYGLSGADWHAANSDRTMRMLARVWGASIEQVENQGTMRVVNPERFLREAGDVIHARFGARLNLVALGPDAWRVQWTPDVPENCGQSQPTAGLCPPDDGKVLRGLRELSLWLFGASHLAFELPRTDDLNYI
jgi:hypothetical protein